MSPSPSWYVYLCSIFPFLLLILHVCFALQSVDSPKDWYRSMFQQIHSKLPGMDFFRALC